MPCGWRTAAGAPKVLSNGRIVVKHLQLIDGWSDADDGTTIRALDAFACKLIGCSQRTPARCAADRDSHGHASRHCKRHNRPFNSGPSRQQSGTAGWAIKTIEGGERISR